MAENASRFISAYNKIDKALRNIYNLRANMTFAEVVRKSAAHSATVRKYEDELIDYSRLRNAIVHNSNDKMVIAEPHINVVEHIEQIERSIVSPPKAIKFAHRAVIVKEDETLLNTIKLMTASDFSNVPVIGKDCQIVGVVNNKLILEALAKNINANLDGLGEKLKSLTVSYALFARGGDENKHFLIKKSTVNVDVILSEFQNNHKLQIIILTSDGTNYGDIDGVLTTTDILSLNKIMEDIGG